MKIQLIAPAEDWQSAVEVTEQEAKVFEAAAKRLGLTTNRDGRKLYIARPAAAPQPESQGNGQGVYYPSGAYLERHPENNSPKYAPGNPSSASPLVAGNPATKIGKHFALGEFAPNSADYDGVRVHPTLVELLDRIRAKVGKTVRVTSGYRPPDYNRSVGGVPNSQHLDGLAADIYVDGMSTAKLHEICDQLVGDQGGVGFYPVQMFVHVDVRGYRARWTG